MKNSYLVIFAVFLLGCTSTGSVPNTCLVNFSNWGVIGLAAMIVLMISGIVYMGANLFRKQDWAFVGGMIATQPGWENWTKKQLYQVAISLFIAAGAGGFAAFSCELSYNLAGSDPFIVADAYLTKLLWQSAIPSTVQMLSFIMTSDAFSSVYFMIGGGTGWGFQWPLITLTPLGNSLNLIFDAIIPLITSLATQQIGLQIIQSTAFTLVLPAGVILRIFPATRDAGSFLIAVAIGFYVVFPLTYVMDNMVMNDVLKVETDSWVLEAANPSALKQSIPQAIYPQYLYGTFNFFTLQWFKLLKSVVLVIPQALFLPALNMVITITFIRIMTKILMRELGD